jgi:hypothetical protein
VAEDHDALPHLRSILLGYAQTKVVAEALVREAGDRGLPVRIYRPALISGDSASGAYNRDDLIATLVRGCVAMRTAPDLDWTLDAVPVDVVARAILTLSRAPGPLFHIVHPRPRHWRECVLWMRMYGYDVRLVSYPAWLRQLERETRTSPGHPLRPLRSFFSDRPAGAAGLTLPELYEERRRAVARADSTLTELEASGVKMPPLDAALLETYFSAFIAGGDLPPVVGRVPSVVGRVFRPGTTVGRGFRLRAKRSGELAVALAKAVRPGDVLPSPTPRDLILTALRDAGHRVADVEIVSSGSDHSIVSELTAWRSKRPSGLFGARVTMAAGDTRDVVAKLKASDADVIAVGEALGDIVDPDVGAAYRRWSDRLGFVASHVREIALYRQNDPRFLRHTPEVLATTANESSGTWLIVMEHIGDARRFDSAGRRWLAPEIASAVEGLAALQSLWFGRDAELRAQPWIGYAQTTASMSEMRPLWDALARHAAPLFSAWAGPDLAKIHHRLVESISDWWRPLEEAPRTLIHHDFNPRNACLRGAGPTLCAYDWELATIGAPQRDLVEFLCFVLAEDAGAEEVTHWIERHRRALIRETGREIDAGAWMSGFRSALSDLLVNRLAIYAMVHRVRPQAFLPRVGRTWRAIHRALEDRG